MGLGADVLLQPWACPCSSLKLHFAASCKSQMLAFPLSILVAVFHFGASLGAWTGNSCGPRCGIPTPSSSEQGECDGEEQGECGISLRISL